METRLYIMYADVFDSPARFQAAFSALSYERREKIMRFYRQKDRNLSLAAGTLIDYGLKQYGLHEKNMQYEYGKNKKPYFKEYKELKFNISHSENLVICGFSDCEIGCDIECIHEDKWNIKIAKQYFFGSEYAYIKQSKNPTNAFYRLWTLKESFVKATGAGLFAKLNSFEVEIGPQVFVRNAATDKIYYFKEYQVERINNYWIACCNEKNRFADKLEWVEYI